MSNGRLVLNLREMEGVYIGDDIELTIINIDSRVEVAIKAPKSIVITRKAREDKDVKGNTKFYSS